MGADVIALQEVTAGLPAAYGVDLALWLGRRLGMSALFAPTAGRLIGDAVLTRARHESFTTTRLPPPDTDPKQLARVRIAELGGFDFHATHLGLTGDERAVQIAAIIATIGPGPSVLAGDLNAGPDDDVIAALRAGGFRDVFEASGTMPTPTWPTGRPEHRIDWLWVRGLEVRSADVSDATASDHRPVYAEIAIGR
jgi:endonuclease/exonuclease/phosphatase family metal-dependent hydrolase